MKSIFRERQKYQSQKKQFNLLHNQTQTTSPVDKKYLINSQNVNFNRLGKFSPYRKKFNVRKLTKTQESISINKEPYKSETKQVKQKIEKLLKHKFNKKQIESIKQIQDHKIKPKLRSLNHTIYVSKNKINQNKKNMQTIQLNDISFFAKKQHSPYLARNRFRTLQNQTQQRKLIFSEEDKITQKKNKYFFFTKLQMQEIQNYQVYFPGQRRIASLKQFTDNQGNAKICVGDSIIYRYEIIKTLGQGSFGQVFKAYDHKKKQQVALKIIKNNPKFNKQARVEIKILQTALMNDANIHHNIVKLKHGFFFRGHACLVFQLLHINLYEFLKFNNFRGLSLDLIRRLSIQILQGLLFFQKFNIIHCDLKPQNILLKQQNKTGIKIIDIGSGCFENQQLYTYIQSRFYRAPEIILGIHYTSAIDIWSFACILCELYTGYPIFPGQNEQQQIQMQIEVLGVPPPQFIERGSRSQKFFQNYQPIIKPNSKGKQKTPKSRNIQKVLKNCQDKNFIRFLQSCFKWLPQQRLKAHEALLDEWILQGLPKQILSQHIQIVKTQSKQFHY